MSAHARPRALVTADRGRRALALAVIWGAPLAYGCGQETAASSPLDAEAGGAAGAAGRSSEPAGVGGSASVSAGGATSSTSTTAVGAGAGAAGAPVVDFACQTPDAQVLEVVHEGATLTFLTSDGAPLELGTTSQLDAEAPDAWQPGDALTLEVTGQRYFIKVFARVQLPDCALEPFVHVYDVRPEYDGAAEAMDGMAVAMDSPDILAWATGYVEPIAYGSELDAMFQTPELALGPAVGDSLDIVALGNGGQLTLTFDALISNGEGPDFAVFENSFSDSFLELGFVEVSSDGARFVRFDSAYLGETVLGAFGTQPPSLMAGLAGKHRQGFGTPFDLDLLRYRPEVQSGAVDLSAITHVRIVDIIGDGSITDSFGHPIYDPTPTAGSGGFDLEALAVLNGG